EERLQLLEKQVAVPGVYSRRSGIAHFPRRQPTAVRLPSVARVGWGRSILSIRDRRIGHRSWSCRQLFPLLPLLKRVTPHTPSACSCPAPACGIGAGRGWDAGRGNAASEEGEVQEDRIVSTSKPDNTERNARIIDLARQGKAQTEIGRELNISRGI